MDTIFDALIDQKQEFDHLAVRPYQVYKVNVIAYKGQDEVMDWTPLTNQQKERTVLGAMVKLVDDLRMQFYHCFQT